MVKIQVLSREDVAGTLKMSQVIDVVESVYRAKSEGSTAVWPTVFYDFEPGISDLDIKSGYLKSKKLYGHKTVSCFGTNLEKNLPALFGMIAVFDAETGQPIGITDAAYITGLRTGAAGALGAKYLARPDSRNLLIVGAGNQAAFQIAAVLTAMPGVRNIQIAALEPAEAEHFVSGIRSRLAAEFGIRREDVDFKAVKHMEAAVKESDIIITVTPSRRPMILKEWVREGTHFSCIGADMEGKHEIDSQIMASAKIFVDDKAHCMQVGEIEIPLKEGVISEADIVGELGDLILGKVTGRQTAEDITVFDATGMALLDIAAAEAALRQADKENIGAKVDF